MKLKACVNMARMFPFNQYADTNHQLNNKQNNQPSNSRRGVTWPLRLGMYSMYFESNHT
jgi:hypothetical protein